ncbi:monoacylglycerol lipase [Tanacetum coccineum]
MLTMIRCRLLVGFLREEEFRGVESDLVGTPLRRQIRDDSVLDINEGYCPEKDSTMPSSITPEMNKEHVEEKRELIIALARDRKLSEIPKISQPTKIIWGDKHQVFPLELGYRLKRHLGDNADIL